jgi:hypothetical protein
LKVSKADRRADIFVPLNLSKIIGGIAAAGDLPVIILT